MTDIYVNDIAITEADVLSEIQYHPAATVEAARHDAAQWLVVRELLLQRAASLGVARPSDNDTSVIGALLEREVDIPDPDDESCRRYYDNNMKRFRSPDLVEAGHILLPAAPDDVECREAAERLAERLIEILKDRPDRFGDLAREHSACNSKDTDGRLGQVARGDTVPEMETFLFNLDDGQLCPVPVKTRFGLHVVRVDKRLPGRQLPYDAVADKIAEYLKSRSWRHAFSQYVQVLAGDAKISGIDIAAADTPLVQ